MLIGKNYKIESDALNVTVFQRAGKKKDGSDRWRAIGYFATTQNALQYLVELEVKETSLVDLKTVVQKQDELYALIKSLKEK